MFLVRFLPMADCYFHPWGITKASALQYYFCFLLNDLFQIAYMQKFLRIVVAKGFVYPQEENCWKRDASNLNYMLAPFSAMTMYRWTHTVCIVKTVYTCSICLICIWPNASPLGQRNLANNTLSPTLSREERSGTFHWYPKPMLFSHWRCW